MLLRVQPFSKPTAQPARPSVPFMTEELTPCGCRATSTRTSAQACACDKQPTTAHDGSPSKLLAVQSLSAKPVVMSASKESGPAHVTGPLLAPLARPTLLIKSFGPTARTSVTTEASLSLKSHSIPLPNTAAPRMALNGTVAIDATIGSVGPVHLCGCMSLSFVWAGAIDAAPRLDGCALYGAMLSSSGSALGSWTFLCSIRRVPRGTRAGSALFFALPGTWQLSLNAGVASEVETTISVDAVFDVRVWAPPAAAFSTSAGATLPGRVEFGNTLSGSPSVQSVSGLRVTQDWDGIRTAFPFRFPTLAELLSPERFRIKPGALSVWTVVLYERQIKTATVLPIFIEPAESRPEARASERERLVSVGMAVAQQVWAKAGLRLTIDAALVKHPGDPGFLNLPADATLGSNDRRESFEDLRLFMQNEVPPKVRIYYFQALRDGLGGDGGGTTKPNAGLPLAYIITSVQNNDFGAPTDDNNHATNRYHIAHELGHVFGLRHPEHRCTAFAQPASGGTILCAYPANDVLRRLNSMWNAANANKNVTFGVGTWEAEPDFCDAPGVGARNCFDAMTVELQNQCADLGVPPGAMVGSCG